jgi:hypothetical protein
MQTVNEIDEVLRLTNYGELTIVVNNETTVDKIRKKHFDIVPDLRIISMKPKRGSPVTFIQATNIRTYRRLTGLVGPNYCVLGYNGKFLPPIPMAT